MRLGDWFDQPILARRPNLMLINIRSGIKKRNADHRKESEKTDKYLDLARKLKVWNKRVTVIPIVVGALERTLKSLEKRLAELDIRVRDHPISQHCLDKIKYLEKSWRP